jgi:hypothetical protein
VPAGLAFSEHDSTYSSLSIECDQVHAKHDPCMSANLAGGNKVVYVRFIAWHTQLRERIYCSVDARLEWGGIKDQEACEQNIIEWLTVFSLTVSDMLWWSFIFFCHF